jgi:hypothetical protein
MADNTGAPWLLPYPESTDLVRDGASDIEALATAVASGLTTAAVVKSVHVANKTAVQTFSDTVGSFNDVTDLSITLTPNSDASKFLLYTQVNMANTATGGRTWNAARVLRGSTNITPADATQLRYTSSDGNLLITPITLGFVDSPSVSTSITYKVQAAQQGSTPAVSVFIDRSEASATRLASSYLVVVEFV